MGNDSVKVSYNYDDSSVYAKTYVCCHGVDSSFSQVSDDAGTTSGAYTSVDVRYDFSDGVDDDIYLTESGKDYIHVMRADTVFWCYDWRVGRLVQRVYFEDGYDGAAIIYNEEDPVTHNGKRFVALKCVRNDENRVDFDNINNLALLPVTLAYKQINASTCAIDQWSGYNMNNPNRVFNPFSVARGRAEGEYDGKSVLKDYISNTTSYKYSVFSVLAEDSSYNYLAVPKKPCVVCSKSNIDNSSGALKMSKLRVFLDIEGVSDSNMSILENVKFALPYKSSEGTTKYIVEKSLSSASELSKNVIIPSPSETSSIKSVSEGVLPSPCEVKFETDSNLNVTVTVTCSKKPDIQVIVLDYSGSSFAEYRLKIDDEQPSEPDIVRFITNTPLANKEGEFRKIVEIKFEWAAGGFGRTRKLFYRYKKIETRKYYYLDFNNIDSSYYTLRLEKQNQESSKSYISIPQESVNFYGKNECESSTDITNNSYWFAGSNENDCTYSTFTVRTDIHYVIYADDQDTRNSNKNTRIKVIGCSIGFKDDLKFKITEESKSGQ